MLHRLCTSDWATHENLSPSRFVKEEDPRLGSLYSLFMGDPSGDLFKTPHFPSAILILL